MSAQNEQFMFTATDSPQTRFGRRRDAGLDFPYPQTIRVHEQAATMFSPCQWPHLSKGNGSGRKLSADSPQSLETVRGNQERDCASQVVASTCRFDRARLTPASWQSFESAKQSRINRKCPGNAAPMPAATVSPWPCPQLFRVPYASASRHSPFDFPATRRDISRVNP